ncbi:lytic transglycosylase [Hylemonella gracilis str. Niagara R]|uniref:Lytic transglycosylase n=1 Tax=Hylemonella gracilis str. Niagara R TaxID=1458275 RepID=A0A016XIX4_9BURK|nr:transglycosylase SLT domain-containing protein [Hylemonella gracilis]EYC51860.1 lytic transglycosylase [Hylemonella gracilis str. Niagara R]
MKSLSPATPSFCAPRHLNLALTTLSRPRTLALAWGLALGLGLSGCALTDELARRDAVPEPAPTTQGEASYSTAQNTPPASAETPQAVTATEAVLPSLPVPAEDLQPLPAPYSPATHAVITLAPPTDLWHRIRQGFTMKDLESPLVLGREQWYAARPEEFVAMIERSRMYLFHIIEEIERRGLPTELALLPFVESAYNPQAYSHARAAGMWQFIPSTGRVYQLRQNAFRDDRRDVLASTRAALDYLEKLHGMFGDWHLALAAYNWGEGAVGRAIAKNKRLKKPTDYVSLYPLMPRETRYYVPKLQAMKNLIADPARFAITLPNFENHPFFDSVAITRDIDVELAAELAEVRLEDFKALNPSLHRPVILAAGTPQILLPWDNAITFERNLASYVAEDKGQLASWTVWTAPRTMKTTDVAKRLKIDEKELRLANAIPSHMIIRAGSTLLVPRASDHEHDVAERIADHGQLNFFPETELRRVVYKAGKRDTVSLIARRYGIAPAKVAEWNQLKVGDSFQPGQNIVLYRWMPVTSTLGTPVRKDS